MNKSPSVANDPPPVREVAAEDVALLQKPSIKKWAWLRDRFDRLAEGRALLIDVPQVYRDDQQRRSEQYNEDAKLKGYRRDGLRSGLPEHIVWACERLASQVRSQLSIHNKDSSFRASVHCTLDFRQVAVYRLEKGKEFGLNEVLIETSPPTSDDPDSRSAA